MFYLCGLIECVFIKVGVVVEIMTNDGKIQIYNPLDFDGVQAYKSDSPILIPAPKGKNYEALGMGEGALYFKKKLYTGLSSFSQDYQIWINKNQKSLLKKTLQSEGWTCF